MYSTTHIPTIPNLNSSVIALDYSMERIEDAVYYKPGADIISEYMGRFSLSVDTGLKCYQDYDPNQKINYTSKYNKENRTTISVFDYASQIALSNPEYAGFKEILIDKFPEKFTPEDKAKIQLLRQTQQDEALSAFTAKNYDPKDQENVLVEMYKQQEENYYAAVYNQFDYEGEEQSLIKAVEIEEAQMRSAEDLFFDNLAETFNFNVEDQFSIDIEKKFFETKRDAIKGPAVVQVSLFDQMTP